ncbi:MAG: hypothetical protein OXF08_07705 [Bacteroidetes bacterium]|nr:hypothetical protein [Bacteroidota bacterium]
MLLYLGINPSKPSDPEKGRESHHTTQTLTAVLRVFSMGAKTLENALENYWTTHEARIGEPLSLYKEHQMLGSRHCLTNSAMRPPSGRLRLLDHRNCLIQQNWYSQWQGTCA